MAQLQRITVRSKDRFRGNKSDMTFPRDIPSHFQDSLIVERTTSTVEKSCRSSSEVLQARI